MFTDCKAAIFDMDGTLLDSMPVWDRLIERYLARFGITPTRQDVEAIESKTLMQCAEFFTTRFPELQMAPQQMWDGLDEMIVENYRAMAKPKPGVLSFLDALQDNGVKLAVATLTSRKHAEEALEYLKMLEYFDVFLTVEDVGKPKTSPDIYLTAASMLGSTPAQSIVFEDAPYAGETAKRAGFRVCGVEEKAYQRGWEQLRAVSDFYVTHSFDELLHINH